MCSNFQKYKLICPLLTKFYFMIQFLLKSIYQLLHCLDNKLGLIDGYDYETAPYCGHHYNGHKGKFTASSYHEGEGEKYCLFLSWVIVKNTEEKTWHIQTKTRFNKYYKRF